MRAFVLMLIFVMTLASAGAQEHGGFGGGNGGDPPATVFRNTGYDIATFLEANPTLYPEIDRALFRGAVRDVTISVLDTERVHCPIEITDSEGTYTLDEMRCSCNYRSPLRIETGSCFAAIGRERSRIQHVAHEIIPLTGQSDRDEVKSNDIARRMTERTSLVGIPDIGLGSAASEDVDEDGHVVGHIAAGSIHVGVGGGLMVDSGGTGTALSGSPMGTLDAYGFLRHRREDRDDRAVWPFLAASGEISAAIATVADQPVYRVSVDLSGSLVPAVGLWFSMDAAQYAALRSDGTITVRGERVFSGGVPLSVFPIMMGRRDMMLIRVNMGAGGIDAPDTGVEEPVPTYAAAIAAIIRHADFFIHVNAITHVGSSIGERDRAAGRLDSRVSVRAALAYTLGLIFPSDAIRLEGSIVSYSIHERPTVSHYDLGLYYEMRF